MKEKWQFEVRDSIVGVLLVGIRKNSRGSWIIDPKKFPANVKQYFMLDDAKNARRVNADEVKSIVDLHKLDNDVVWQRRSAPLTAKGVVTLDAPPPRPDPLDEATIGKLDAYGHLSYSVGYDNRKHGDWLACFDFEVFKHPKLGLRVAYHTVVDSDSGGFIDTPESAVVPADKAPFDLPDYWADIACEHGGMTSKDLKEAAKVNKQWNEDLKKAIEAAKKGN